MCPTTAIYDELLKNGWFMHLADGTPINGLPYDRAGSDIDTTNPDAAKWYWNTIRDNILSKGFDSLWADETEPDLPPNGALFPHRSRDRVLQRLSALPHRRRSTTASARTSRSSAR